MGNEETSNFSPAHRHKTNLIYITRTYRTTRTAAKVLILLHVSAYNGLKQSVAAVDGRLFARGVRLCLF